MEAQGQKMELDTEQKNRLSEDSALVTELVWLSYGDTDLALKGIEKIDEKEAFVIQIGENRTAFYDKASGLKLKQDTVQEMQGQTITQSTTFKDYKEVSGLMIPHVVSQNLGPQTVDFTIEKAIIN